MPILPNNTLSSIVNLVNRANSDPVVQPPLSNAAFTLDSSGVAGFFGGESAVRAMGTAYLIPTRRWLGWYNAPGAYEVAKQYSGLAKSHLFNALFPTGDRDPAKILMVDGQLGPECTPLHSPTKKAPSSIGHLGSLIAGKISQMPVTKVLELGTKRTMDARVTFVNLRRDVPGESCKIKLFPSSSIVFTIFIIFISVGGCIACALVADWFCFSSIALGIIANGVACSVIGSGELYLKNNPPPQAGSPGDVLLKSDTNLIVLVGDEGMVRPFTHGRFVLRFEEMAWFSPKRAGNTPKPNPLMAMVSWSQWILQECLTVDISVILLLFQFLAQLLLIPQGTLFGQIMFIGTLAPSWVYHSYLSTLGLDLQTQALFQTLSLQENDIFHYQLNTWTQAAVFACLVFRSIHPPEWLSSATDVDMLRQERALVAKMSRKAAKAEQKKKSNELEDKIAQAKKEREDKEAEVAKVRSIVKEEENKSKHMAKEAAAAQKAAEKAGLEVKVAEAEAEVESKVGKAEKTGLVGKVAEAEVGVEADGENTTQVNKAVEVATKKLKAINQAMKAANKADEANVAAEAATEAQKDLERLENEVKEAEKAEEKLVAEKNLNKTMEEDKKKWKQKEKERKTLQKEKADRSLYTLLDALLPGQTDVWLAFKQSLVRRLSAEAENKSCWAYMESGWTFEFDNPQCRSIEVQDDVRMLETAEDLAQLRGYQDDANSALATWRDGNICEIARQFQ